MPISASTRSATGSGCGARSTGCWRCATRRREGSQLHLEGLADEILAEIPVRLLRHQLEPGLLIDMPRGVEALVGPQRHLAIAGFPGEAQRLVHQPRPDAEPPRLRQTGRASLRESVGQYG